MKAASSAFKDVAIYEPPPPPPPMCVCGAHTDSVSRPECGGARRWYHTAGPRALQVPPPNCAPVCRDRDRGPVDGGASPRFRTTVHLPGLCPRPMTCRPLPSLLGRFRKGFPHTCFASVAQQVDTVTRAGTAVRSQSS